MRILAFHGDEEEEDDIVEEDRGALGPFWLLVLLEVGEDDDEASQRTVEHARWFSAPLFLKEEGETEGRKGVAAARGGRGNPRARPGRLYRGARGRGRRGGHVPRPFIV